jgi:hypothetical protein
MWAFWQGVRSSKVYLAPMPSTSVKDQTPKKWVLVTIKADGPESGIVELQAYWTGQL